MILIFSEEIDRTTDIVCNWLNYYKQDFLRINDEKSFSYQFNLSIFDNSYNVNVLKEDICIPFSEIDCVWFRRGFIRFALKINRGFDKLTLNNIKNHLNNEGRTLEYFLYYMFKTKFSINNPQYYNFNKLIALFEASRIGFSIPETLISNDTIDLYDFLNIHENCITKHIQDIMPIKTKTGTSFGGRTMRITKNELKFDKYWYSLIQKEIKKKYEVRVFYLMKKIYPMVIFSQDQKQSSVDYRNVSINSNHSNRMVPYKLPTNIQRKITKLMTKLNLESGSIDLIVDHNNNFFFLEVNPVGQFNFLSELCNYYIEKDISLIFKNETEKINK
jgi:ATP-GRASP peptide maturase of grasp-with-spasm system